MLQRGTRAPLVGIVAGLVAGVGLSAVLARVGVVRGVRLADPVSVLGTLGLLTTIALVAMADPVRRIFRQPAMTALREE